MPDDPTSPAIPETAASSPLPPPPPPAPKRRSPGSAQRTTLLWLLALVGLAVGALMTILWVGSRSDADEARADRDAAVLERDAATEARIDAEAELAATNDALTAAQAGGMSDGDEAGDNAERAALEARIEELDAEVERLTREGDRLRAEADSLRAAAEVDTPTETTTTATTTTETPTPDAPTETTVPASSTAFDISTAPEFARYIGELLTSAGGASQLNAAESTCFGSAVIGQIGLEALGDGQNNAAGRTERQVVIDAMVAAAGACNIDQSRVF